MSVLDRVRSVFASPIQANAPTITLDDYIRLFDFGGAPFPLSYMNPLGQKEEEITSAYGSLVNAMRINGVVYACELVRVMLFSEARFLFRQRRSGRPGDLFSSAALRLLDRPRGPGSTTAELLKRAMLHADFGGTGFMVERRGKIRQPRPDWMTIVLGSYTDPEIDGDSIDAEVIGYLYHPGGRGMDYDPVVLLPSEVATFVPIPDPIAHVRGIPWTSAVTRNVMGHNAATTHKLKFFENGATPQIIVSLDKDVVTDTAKFKAWIDAMEARYAGGTKAYKTLYLGAGATATVVGRDLQQLDFKATQGADEAQIAAAAGVGAVVAQLSEGLQGSSLNSGNFAQAMRRVADITMRPLWRDMAGSLEVFVPPADDAELWYDDSDIPALKDDIKDRAAVMAQHAQAMRTLADGGWKPDAVVEAIEAGDLKRLKGNHTGLLSVQMQVPGTNQQPAATDPAREPARQLAATASSVPLLASGEGFRCPSCDKLIARALGPGTDLDCPRCKAAIVA